MSVAILQRTVAGSAESSQRRAYVTHNDRMRALEGPINDAIVADLRVDPWFVALARWVKRAASSATARWLLRQGPTARSVSSRASVSIAKRAVGPSTDDGSVSAFADRQGGQQGLTQPSGLHHAGTRRRIGVDSSRPSTLSTSPRSSSTGCRRAEERGWRVLSRATHPDPTYGSVVRRSSRPTSLGQPRTTSGSSPSR